MATIKQASGSILTSVVSVSNAAANVVDAVSQSADIFTAYIAKAKSEQAMRYTVESAQYAKNLAREAAVIETKQIIELKSFASQSDDHASVLTEQLEYFTNLVVPK